MKLKIVLIFSVFLGWQAVVSAVHSTSLPEQQMERVLSKKKKKKKRFASVKANAKENLIWDYLLGIGSVALNLLVPGVALGGAAALAIILLLAPYFFSIAVFSRAKRRKRKGRKTPKLVIALAIFGLAISVGWLVQILFLGGL